MHPAMKTSREPRQSKADAKKRRGSPPRIALLVAAWNDYGRGIIEGVWQYAEQHGPWLLEMQPGEPEENTGVPLSRAHDSGLQEIPWQHAVALPRERTVGEVSHGANW